LTPPQADKPVISLERSPHCD